MNIREDSKKIVRYFLEKAIDCGNLTEPFQVDYGALAKELNLKSGNYCCVCCAYLATTGRASLSIGDEADRLALNGYAVDFIEVGQ